MHNQPRQPLSALRGGRTKPDLEGEEDIIKELLAVNRKEIKITTFFQNKITEAICLKLKTN